MDIEKLYESEDVYLELIGYLTAKELAVYSLLRYSYSPDSKSILPPARMKLRDISGLLKDVSTRDAYNICARLRKLEIMHISYLDRKQVSYAINNLEEYFEERE